MEGQELRERRRAHRSGSFFRGWLQDPFSVGAVAPSGRELGRLMTTGLAPGARVVELGGGTGTLTRAILQRGVSRSDLHIVEHNAAFADRLRRTFPGCRVVAADAGALARHMRGLRGRVDFIVSGLPLLLFSNDQKMRVLNAAFSLLAPGGRLHQFTYGGRCSVNRSLLDRMDLQASLVGVAALNIPPAFVYRLMRIE